ncbi:MAG: prephenate dehydrogenase, partial [Candidatus Binatia bacterium]
MTKRYERVVVVGTGLIGASLAAAGRARGRFAHVVGVGRSMANLETARERGLIDEATTELFAALADSDLIVLATPVVTAVSQIHELVHHAPPAAVITDVGSVKLPIVLEARRRGLATRFLGAHPLAGKAETGAGAADPDLFRGRRVVLTPDEDTPPELVEDMRSLWSALEAEVSVMDADDHDAVLARSSHLPQMVAYALAATADSAEMREDLVRLVAGGFRDTTRLAASDADMWVDIARLNREAIVDAMDEFSVIWDDLRDAIADQDETVIRALIG